MIPQKTVDYQINQNEITQRVDVIHQVTCAKTNEMIEKSTDAHCIEVAENIARNKLAGLSTATLEDLLKYKMSQMKLNTNILNGFYAKSKPKY